MKIFVRISGALSIAWLLFFRYYVRKRSKRKSNTSTNHASTANIKVPWLLIFTRPEFWALLAAHFSHSNSWFLIFSWIPSFFHERFPETPVSTLTAFILRFLLRTAVALFKLLHLLRNGTINVCICNLLQAYVYSSIPYFISAITSIIAGYIGEHMIKRSKSPPRCSVLSEIIFRNIRYCLSLIFRVFRDLCA